MEQNRDDWQTPKSDFDQIAFLTTPSKPFSVDACARAHNSRCVQFLFNALRPWLYGVVLSRDCSITGDGNLGKDEIVFMNPPYSNIGPFLFQAWEYSQYGRVVCLLPVTSLSCRYMDILDQQGGGGYTRVWKSGVTIYFLTSRLQFINPKSLKPGCAPRGGSMLVVLDRR